MRIDKEAVFLYKRCLGYRKVVDAVVLVDDEFSLYSAAYNLAMCCEFALKFLLYVTGNDVTKTHNHKVLIRLCGESGIMIPKEVRVVSEYIYEFEAATRYDSDFVLDIEIYNKVYAAVDLLLGTIDKYYIHPIADEIRSKLPPSLQSALTDSEVFNTYCNLL